MRAGWGMAHSHDLLSDAAGSCGSLDRMGVETSSLAVGRRCPLADCCRSGREHLGFLGLLLFASCCQSQLAVADAAPVAPIGHALGSVERNPRKKKRLHAGVEYYFNLFYIILEPYSTKYSAVHRTFGTLFATEMQ